MENKALTVAELITLLSAHDPDQPVWYEADGGIAPVTDANSQADADGDIVVLS
jgi:hypothetical protein